MPTKIMRTPHVRDEKCQMGEYRIWRGEAGNQSPQLATAQTAKHVAAKLRSPRVIQATARAAKTVWSQTGQSKTFKCEDSLESDW